MRMRITKDIVPYKLSRELRAAGVELVHDVRPLPNGLYVPLIDESQADELLDIIETAIDAHDGINDIAALKESAKLQIKNIPGWATWDFQQGIEWYDTEIKPLSIPASVKAFIRASTLMHIAIRDYILPELKDE